MSNAGKTQEFLKYLQRDFVEQKNTIFTQKTELLYIGSFEIAPFIFLISNENRSVCKLGENFKIFFNKDRSEIQFESFFSAEINKDAKTGLSINARLIKAIIV